MPGLPCYGISIQDDGSDAGDDIEGGGYGLESYRNFIFQLFIFQSHIAIRLSWC